MTSRRRGLAVFAIAFVLALVGAGARAQAPEGRLYTPGAFDRLEIDGAGAVRLVQADRDEVFVKGDAQAQSAVSVERVGHAMQISLPGGWKFWDNDKTQVEVRMRNVSRVTLSGVSELVAAGTIKSPQLAIDIAGSGVARFEDLRAEALSFTISGSGEGQLAGRVDALKLSVSGRGKISADQLQVADARVSISGVGNADLWVTDTLNASISGAGHVHYRGQPKVRQSISGLGSVEASPERR
jgi:hypothetical protein